MKPRLRDTWDVLHIGSTLLSVACGTMDTDRVPAAIAGRARPAATAPLNAPRLPIMAVSLPRRRFGGRVVRAFSRNQSQPAYAGCAPNISTCQPAAVSGNALIERRTPI